MNNPAGLKRPYDVSSGNIFDVEKFLFGCNWELGGDHVQRDYQMDDKWGYYWEKELIFDRLGCVNSWLINFEVLLGKQWRDAADKDAQTEQIGWELIKSMEFVFFEIGRLTDENQNSA